jgi:hypothetical protein
MSKARIEQLERENRLLREQLARMRQDPGECPVLACDNSCVCATATGMATNGGCRCDERKLRRAVGFWRARAQYLEEVVRIARDTDNEAGIVAWLERWLGCYSTDVFPEPEPGKHGLTVDGCSARAFRVALTNAIRGIREGTWRGDT